MLSSPCLASAKMRKLLGSQWVNSYHESSNGYGGPVNKHSRERPGNLSFVYTTPMTPSGYVCSEVDFPICKVLKLEQTTWLSEEKSPFSIEIQSPYTVALLLISVLCALRMISHVNSLYASIGRGEMRTFFLLYIISSSLQAALIGFGKHFPRELFIFATVFQVSFQSTMYFALFVAGMTIDRIYGIFGMKSSHFMRALTAFFWVFISFFVFSCCTTRNDFVLLLVLGINSLSVFFYLTGQVSKLKRINEDIWAYGILGIIFLIYCAISVNTFVGAELIAIASERNLDSLFFISLCSFMLVMMAHKYWLSTCDFELECLSLPL